MMAPSPTDQKIAALQQRYAQSQQLIDLLALQKLKQEKDAAARDMQMKAAQQMGGAGIPTVKEQLETEMVGRSKQEVTEQLNTLAAQKQQQQQQALQRVAQTGIAQNPVPMNFAGGGIVAFADGDFITDEIIRRKKESGGLLGRLLGGPPPGAITIQERLAEIERQLELTPRGTAKHDALLEARAQLRGRQTNPNAQRPVSVPQPDAPAQTATQQPVTQIAPNVNTPRAAPQAAAPQAAAPQAAAPKPAAPATPGAQPPAAQNPAVSAQVNEGIGGVIKNLLSANPSNAASEEEAHFQKQLALTPEQRGVYEQGIASAQRRMQELSDPERMNREARIRGMLAAAGGGGFAAYGAGDLNAQEQQRLARKQAEEDYSKAAEGLVGIERANTLKALESRAKTREIASREREAGVEATIKLYNIDEQSRNAGLDRTSRETIAKLQVAAQREANRLQAEYNNSIKTDAEYRRTVDSMTRYSNDVAKPYDRMIENLQETIGLTGKPTPEQQTQLKNLRDARDLAVQNVRELYEPMLNKYNPEGASTGLKVVGSRPAT